MAPAPHDGEGPSDRKDFGAPSHGFCTGCLRFVPPSRTTTQNSLPVVSQPFRVGFYIPTEFVRRVSALASPLPGLILARYEFLLQNGKTEVTSSHQLEAMQGFRTELPCVGQSHFGI